MIQKILEKSRYLIVIAVVGAYLASAIVIIYDGLLLVHVLIELFRPSNFQLYSGSATDIRMH